VAGNVVDDAVGNRGERRRRAADPTAPPLRLPVSGRVARTGQ